MKEICNANEKKFSEYLESIGTQYIYHPKVDILNRINYTPDFYVLQNNSFYEVIGTRQAFSENKQKIFLAKALINLFIVNPDGTPYIYNENKMNTMGKSNHTVSFCEVDVAGFLFKERLTPFELHSVLGVHLATSNKMIRLNKMNVKYVVKLAKTYPSIMDYVNGKSKELIIINTKTEQDNIIKI